MPSSSVATIGFELAVVSKSATGLGASFFLNGIVWRTSTTITPESSVIHVVHGPCHVPRLGHVPNCELNVLSDVIGNPQMPAPRSRNRTAYMLVNTPSPKNLRNLCASRKPVIAN